MATQMISTAWDLPTSASSQTTCDGCHQRVASRAARIVSLGAVAPGGDYDEAAKVFHRLECLIEHEERAVLEAGLADL